jgi:putative sensor protein
MLMDARTWTTLLYLVLMLPLGIVYFTIAITGLSLGLALSVTPLVAIAQRLGWAGDVTLFSDDAHIGPLALGHHSLLGAVLLGALGVVILTLLMHLARAIGHGHSRLAKALLVKPGT